MRMVKRYGWSPWGGCSPLPDRTARAGRARSASRASDISATTVAPPARVGRATIRIPGNRSADERDELLERPTTTSACGRSASN